MNINPNSSSVSKGGPSNGALQPVSFANGTIRSGFNSENINWLLENQGFNKIYVNTRRAGTNGDIKIVKVDPNLDLSDVGLREGLAVIDHCKRNLQCAKALIDREYDLDASRIFADIANIGEDVTIESRNVGVESPLIVVKYKNLEMYVIKCGDGYELCVDYVGNEGPRVADREFENFLTTHFPGIRDQQDRLELRVGDRRASFGIPVRNAFSEGEKYLASGDGKKAKVLLDASSIQLLKSSETLLDANVDISSRYDSYEQLKNLGLGNTASQQSWKQGWEAYNASFSSEEVGGIIDNMQKYKQRLVQQEITKKAIELRADLPEHPGQMHCLNYIRATLDVISDAEEFEQKQLEKKVGLLGKNPDEFGLALKEELRQKNIEVEKLKSLTEMLESGIANYQAHLNFKNEKNKAVERFPGYFYSEGEDNILRSKLLNENQENSRNNYDIFSILGVVQDLKVNFNLSDVDLSKLPYADILMENLTDIEAVLLSDLDGKKFGIPEVKLEENFEYSDENLINWKDSFTRKSLLENNRNKDAGETLLEETEKFYPKKSGEIGLGEIRHDASQHLHSWIEAFDKCIIYEGGIESAEDANKKIEDSDGKETVESFEKRAEAWKWLNFAKSLEKASFDKVSGEGAEAEDQKISAKDIVADLLTKVLNADDIKRAVQRMYNTWEAGNVSAILKRYKDNPNTDAAVGFHYGLDNIGAESQSKVEGALAILFTQEAIQEKLLKPEDGERFYNELCKAFISNRISSVSENNNNGGGNEPTFVNQNTQQVQPPEFNPDQSSQLDGGINVNEVKGKLLTDANASPVKIEINGPEGTLIECLGTDESTRLLNRLNELGNSFNKEMMNSRVNIFEANGKKIEAMANNDKLDDSQFDTYDEYDRFVKENGYKGNDGGVSFSFKLDDVKKFNAFIQVEGDERIFLKKENEGDIRQKVEEGEKKLGDINKVIGFQEKIINPTKSV